MVMLPSSSKSLLILKRKDLKMEVFNSSAYEPQTICSGVLHDRGNAPNYYRYLQLWGDNLYVGAMNCLLRLDKDVLTHRASKHFPVDTNEHWRCTVQGKADIPDCQNHIRAVMPDMTNSSNLFVCGTSSYSPKKYVLYDDNLNNTISQGDGQKLCPFDPLDNVTSLYVENGNPGNRSAYYFGLYADFIKNYPVIFRPSYTVNETSYPELLPAKADVTWLNTPQFVGSFEEDSTEKGNQVFYFFREIAEEYTASKTKIFSRVAKVCKNDRGGGSIDGEKKKKWLSYQKARLNCSLPGSQPYYFDDIYDVYQAGDLFYALFHKPGEQNLEEDWCLADLNSSAICVYNKSDIFNVFEGSFRLQVNKVWETLPPGDHPDPRLDNCKIHDTNPSAFDGKVSRYQLMKDNVNPLFGKPIFYQKGIQFVKLVVIDDTDGHGANIYVASDTGEIYNVFVYLNPDLGWKKPQINSKLIPLEESHPIWNMKLLDKNLYVGTDYSVAKINLLMCDTHKKRDNCILQIDCYWCRDNSRCQSSPGSCSDYVTYKTLYDLEVGEPDLDFSLITDAERNYIHDVRAMKGLYTTLDISYELQRSGHTIWKKDDQEIDFIENDRLFLSTDGALIIRNISLTDSGNFTAYDTVYDRFKRVAMYLLNVTDSENKMAMVEAWKQEFNDWSTQFSLWKSCSQDYFDQCTAP